MPVSNPSKTVSNSSLDCNGMTTVTLSFDAEAELRTAPADIVLIMDRSGSTSGAPLAEAKLSAKQLIRTVALASGSVSGDTIENQSTLGLVSFADSAEKNEALTTDVIALNSAVDGLSAGGFTNHAAAFTAAQELLESAANSRKIIIMFTDGETNVGGDPAPVAEAIKQSGIEIYGIGLLTDATELDAWASTPATEYVASTGQVSQLQKVFAQIAAEVSGAGAQDMVLRETLNPDFKISSINPPSHGSVDLLNPQTLEWKADAVGAAAPETASFSFEAMHIGSSGGIKDINQAVVYADRAGNKLQFDSPKVDVNCDGPVIIPEPCPLPSTFAVESCQDSVVADARDTLLTGLGRIVQVDAVIKDVCPGKQVAVAVILTELDSDGVEHTRGTKSLLIPAQAGTECRDILLKCINFVVPEAISTAGSQTSICAARGFRTRVLANYVDSDFVCCDAQTVII